MDPMYQWAIEWQACHVQVPDKSPALKALSVQTREVGERSWSVLDTEAVTGLKAGLKAAAAHKKDQ